jgi:class 3 adenylate cyclase
VILLVDIKGYTTYTQRLMNKDRAGAEKVSLILNDFFSPQVELTYNSGGDILYFAGDSYTVLFDLKRQ